MLAGMGTREVKWTSADYCGQNERGPAAARKHEYLFVAGLLDTTRRTATRRAHTSASDAKRGASEWRCPTGECRPASVWIKADRLHPLIPRETPRWTALYRRRAAVERAFGRLKHE